MSSTSTDRRFGVNSGMAIKVPCAAATTANITLSGEQTIDGVACVTGDRVLVKNQTTGSQNGIWEVDTGAWSRAKDFDDIRDVTEGTLISVIDGTVNSDTMWRVTNTGTITPGSTALTFENAMFSDSASVAFIQSGTGAVERTAQSKLRDFVSVKDFGATGDGVTDDTSAITAAIAAVVAVSLEARPSLYFPAGDYKVTSPITNTDDAIHIFGDGNAAPFDSLSSYAGGSKITYAGSALTTDTQGVIQLGSASNQCRGVKIENLTIDAATLGNAIHGEQLNSFVLERVTTLQAEWGVYLKGSNNNSNSFVDCVFYDPNTGGGGIDLRENAHSNDITRCSFANKSTGTRNPVNAVRIAQTANCSAVNITGCNFDYYRVSNSHVRIANDCKGFGFSNNYIEAKDDGVTAGSIIFGGGGGISVTGNRFSTAGASALDYGVDFQGTAESGVVCGNYFSGFATAAVRIASGASNIDCFSNECAGGITHVNNQNAAGSKNGMSLQNGDMVTDSVTTDAVTASTGTITNLLPTKVVHQNAGTLTIAAGVITVTGSWHRVDTEAAAATDDLDTINGGADGMVLYLAAANSARDIVIKDGTGNIQCGADFTLGFGRDKIELFYDSAAGVWSKIASSAN